MSRVYFIFAEGHIAEIFENIGQKNHVQSQVVVMVVFHRLTVVTLPRLQCTIVIFLRDSFHVQFAVKLVSRRKTRFSQNFGTRDVLVRINSFFENVWIVGSEMTFSVNKFVCVVTGYSRNKFVE